MCVWPPGGGIDEASASAPASLSGAVDGWDWNLSVRRAWGVGRGTPVGLAAATGVAPVAALSVGAPLFFPPEGKASLTLAPRCSPTRGEGSDQNTTDYSYSYCNSSNNAYSWALATMEKECHDSGSRQAGPAIGTFVTITSWLGRVL